MPHSSKRLFLQDKVSTLKTMATGIIDTSMKSISATVGEWETIKKAEKAKEIVKSKLTEKTEALKDKMSKLGQ